MIGIVLDVIEAGLSAWCMAHSSYQALRRASTDSFQLGINTHLLLDGSLLSAHRANTLLLPKRLLLLLHGLRRQRLA